MRIWLLWVLGLSSLGLARDATAEVKRLVIGGEHPWSGKITAFDLVFGTSLQLREYKPYQNILLMLDKKDEKGAIWFPYYMGEDVRVDYDYVHGEDPVLFTWSPGGVRSEFFDGYDTTGTDQTSPERTYQWRSVIFGTGVPVRVSRFVFYPVRKMEDTPTVPEGYYHSGSPYWETYMRGYQVSASLYEEPKRRWPGSQPLEVILKEEPANHENLVTIAFPLQTLRFFKLTNTVTVGYTIGEIELYGEGFAPEAWYTSEIIDLKEPVNFGRIFWDFKKFRWRREWRWKEPEEPGRFKELELKRKVIPELWEEVPIDPEPIIWEDAPVSISVEVRAGNDDSPLIYYKIDDMGNEKGEVVTKKEYFKLRKRRWEFTKEYPPHPGMRGLIEYDDENWSPWMPVPTSGMEAAVPDVRRYVQFRVKVYSDDPWAFGRLDSLWIEYSVPLAREVAGEVCIQGEPEPEGGTARVEAGEDTTFVYALRASFDSPKQVGFDALRIITPTKPKFQGLWMGKPLRRAEPYSVVEEDGYLEVYLPRKVTRNDDPVQVAFRTAVLAYGTRFLGEVWDSKREDLLPQNVVPGDAVDEIKTNQLQVFVTEASLKVLTGVTVKPEVITPNGDGSNEHTTITYTLSLVVGGAEVEVGVYDVTGAKVKVLEEGVMGSVYRREVEWDGRDEEGELVRPGVYLCRVRVRTDTGETIEIEPVTVVY